MVLVHLENGKSTEITSEELVAKSNEVWRVLENSASDPHPVFLASDLEKPLGLAAFLACSTNFKKVYISGTYNMGKML